MPDALTLLETRRTISSRALASPGPSQTEIETLIRIAARVPDHGKLAPWRFILFSGAAMPELDARVAALYEQRNPAADPARLALEKTRFTGVPLTIGVVSRARPHVKIPEWEQVLSVGAATMNLVMAAHALGFSAQWLTEWIAYDAEARGVLGLAEDERLAGLVAIGTPTVAPVDRPRPTFADITSEWKP